MNIWIIREKFNETLLDENEDFYSYLNMGDITDADYAYAKRVCKDFEINNLGEYRDLYVQSNILLLANVSMCLEIFETDPARFFTILKMTKVTLYVSTDIRGVRGSIRGGVCHGVNRYVKANNIYMRNYDKNKESSYLKYWNGNNLQMGNVTKVTCK